MTTGTIISVKTYSRELALILIRLNLIPVVKAGGNISADNAGLALFHVRWHKLEMVVDANMMWSQYQACLHALYSPCAVKGESTSPLVS
ncbi:hypothetical protein OESDEN_16715 [Oesophagostomum dentatum]|uniref:Uncharacterized protein n=1 Tax=Oesophagostomum dentatum TaxID=61180 RepID=A0A0B1SK55_OESDE|nr:hypothetical protein OESDEN_16715 [Oesophagostomum dentatum]